MKNTNPKWMVIIMLFNLVAMGCSGNSTISSEDARALVSGNIGYPDTISSDIYLASRVEASKVLKAGLEDLGLVKVARTQKLKDVGKPLITFTPAAGKYLLSVSPEEKYRPVLVAVEVLDSILGVTPQESPGQISVLYSTRYQEVTPFSVLNKRDYGKKRRHEAIFRKIENGWIFLKQREIR